jgi:hypothetical protein
MILVRALVPLLVVVVAAFSSYRFMDSVGPDIANSSGGTTGGVPKRVEANDSGSLVKAANFGKVLAKIRKQYGSEARLVNLRLEPSRVDVQVPQGDKTVVLEYDSEANEKTNVTTDTDLRDNPNLASILDVPANAPQRIMKKIVKKTGLPITNLSYMVITTFGPDGVGWYVSLDKGDDTTWRAELDGTKVRAQ